MSSLFWNTSLWTGPLAAEFSGWGDIAYYVGAVAAAVAYLLLRQAPPLSRKRLTGVAPATRR